MQGYHLGCNFGLGKMNLSGAVTILMMLAYLIDMEQQMIRRLFKVAVKRKIDKNILGKVSDHFFEKSMSIPWKQDPEQSSAYL